MCVLCHSHIFVSMYITFNCLIISLSMCWGVKYVPCITSCTGAFITFLNFWKQFSFKYKEASKQRTSFSFHFYFISEYMLERHLKVFIINLRQFLFNVQLTIYAWIVIFEYKVIIKRVVYKIIYLIKFLFHSHCTNEFYHPTFFTISSLHIHVHVHTDKIKGKH